VGTRNADGTIAWGPSTSCPSGKYGQIATNTRGNVIVAYSAAVTGGFGLYYLTGTCNGASRTIAWNMPRLFTTMPQLSGDVQVCMNGYNEIIFAWTYGSKACYSCGYYDEVNRTIIWLQQCAKIPTTQTGAVLSVAIGGSAGDVAIIGWTGTGVVVSGKLNYATDYTITWYLGDPLTFGSTLNDFDIDNASQISFVYEWSYTDGNYKKFRVEHQTGYCTDYQHINLRSDLMRLALYSGGKPNAEFGFGARVARDDAGGSAIVLFSRHRMEPFTTISEIRSVSMTGNPDAGTLVINGEAVVDSRSSGSPYPSAEVEY
jgi:hypothetical protein